MFFKKKKEYKPDLSGIEKPKTLGYLNPLWKIRVTYKGQEIINMGFCYLVSTYLKDYGFKPEEKIDPPLCVELNTGAGVVKMPLFIKEMVGPEEFITSEIAVKKGMVYRSEDKGRS